MRGLPPLGVLENTPTMHHLVVCTLCSCYPRAVLGYPAVLVQVAGLPRPRHPRPGRRARRMGHAAGRRTSASAWWTAPPTTAGWCCRCARPAPRAGTKRRLAGAGARGRHDRGDGPGRVTPLGVVVGLEAEARLARRWGIPVAVGGGDAAGAARAAEALAPGVRGPHQLRPGRRPRPGACAPARCWSPTAWWTGTTPGKPTGGCKRRWAAAPDTRCSAAAPSSPPPPPSARPGRAGAHAVDLESAAVARVAAAAGKPSRCCGRCAMRPGRDLPASGPGRRSTVGADRRRPGRRSRCCGGRDRSRPCSGWRATRRGRGRPWRVAFGRRLV